MFSFLLVHLISNKFWASTNNWKVSCCGIYMSFPTSCLSPDHYRRLINRCKIKWSKKSKSQDASTKYVTTELFLGDRLGCCLKVNLMKTLLWEKGWNRPCQPQCWTQNNSRLTDAPHLCDYNKETVMPFLSSISGQKTMEEKRKMEGKSFH